MRTIAIMSPKGGIAKTTSADTIAYILGEEKGKKVLLIDADPQGDTSKVYQRYDPEGEGLSGLLERHRYVGGGFDTSYFIEQTDYQNIDIITANGYLMQTDMRLRLEREKTQIERLRETLKEVDKQYDYCICDCGRLLDIVVINVLIAAEMVIAPVKLGGFENEAIYNLQEQLDDLCESNEKLHIKGIITMRQKNKTTLEFEQWMKEQSGFKMFKTPVRRSIVVEKASMAMKPLPAFSKNSVAVKDYRAIVEELLGE